VGEEHVEHPRGEHATESAHQRREEDQSDGTNDGDDTNANLASEIVRHNIDSGMRGREHELSRKTIEESCKILRRVVWNYYTFWSAMSTGFSLRAVPNVLDAPQHFRVIVIIRHSMLNDVMEDVPFASVSK
jgi:hypothetical protein